MLVKAQEYQQELGCVICHLMTALTPGAIYFYSAYLNSSLWNRRRRVNPISVNDPVR